MRTLLQVATLAAVLGLARTASAIQGGTREEKSPYVFAVVSEQFTRLCTGTLLAPNLMLTARHCVDRPTVYDDLQCSTTYFAENGRSTSLVVANCTDVSKIQDCNPWFRSAKIYRPETVEFCGHDVVLVALGENVPASVATPVVPSFRPMGLSDLREPFDIVGFGGEDASGRGWGTRRRGDTMQLTCVRDVLAGDPSCSIAAFGATIHPWEFVGGTAACRGDSGAAAFLPAQAGGVTQALGVLTRAGSQSTLCVSGIFLGLEKWRPFMQASAVDAARIGGYPVPAWAKTDALRPLGDKCVLDTECSSQLCGSGGECAAACNASTSCPADYSCHDGLCSADPKSCSASPSAVLHTRGFSSSYAVFALGGVGALAVLRRARNRRMRGKENDQ